jgi:hypothetical protein
VPDQDAAPLPHLWVRDRAEDRAFNRRGRGDPKVRDVEFRSHGQARHRELDRSLAEADVRRAETAYTLDELRALGSVVVLEGAEATYPLRVDSLERLSSHRKEPKRPLWQLLSVTPATETNSERAMVWVNDEYRPRFLKLFEEYLERTSSSGKPWNRELVANIARIRVAVLDDLWQSVGSPPKAGTHWWELWLRPTDDGVNLLRAYAEVSQTTLADRVLRLTDRTVAWIEGTWNQLENLPFTAVPLAEIRTPEFVDTIEDLPREDQEELGEDLVARVAAAREDAPAVCHLDTGVRRTHALLAPSLSVADTHSVVGSDLAAIHNHGTLMAGLALYGPLDALLLGTATVTLRHRLESVKILPDSGAGNDPLTYGVVTAAAVAAPQATAPRRPRVYCMPVTADPDRPGEPTLWSAAVDALAAGVDVGQSADGIDVLGVPDPDAARLFVISAGNVNTVDFQSDYQAACDTSAIEDPAHAWNAITVGAHTELTVLPQDPSFSGWSALGAAGDISPHSRTSMTFASRSWPVKPDICMEGGNVLTDGGVDYDESHPLLSLRTTDNRNDMALGSANATSAATAQAARLGALAMATYPDFWPETVRGLLPHAARWTPTMRSEIDADSSRAHKLRMLRRYGWGVPTESAVLDSNRAAVTMVTQDSFVPFEGEDFLARVFRLHRLPWPEDTLRDLGAADVTLRVTLSYFIEPTASRRGWRRRYAYASHGLRFELRAPTEKTAEFISRVNHDAQAEEDGQRRPSGRADRWVVGSNQRNLGSLHQDLWEGSGAELADCGVLAVHPVGGWWKNAQRKDRINLPVRYGLLVSLITQETGVDLYTPIAVELDLPVETAIPAS